MSIAGHRQLDIGIERDMARVVLGLEVQEPK